MVTLDRIPSTRNPEYFPTREKVFPLDQHKEDSYCIQYCLDFLHKIPISKLPFIMFQLQHGILVRCDG